MRSLQRGAANAEFCQRHISFCTVHVNNDILRKDRQTLLFIHFKPEFTAQVVFIIISVIIVIHLFTYFCTFQF